MNSPTLLPGLSERESELLHEFHSRQNAKNSLLGFIGYTYPGYQAKWFHELICQKLDAFTNRDIQKLMIFVPPQHGKSQISSRSYPAFRLGKEPACKIALCSYAATLASGFNRDVQRIIDSETYHALFPETTLNDSNVVKDSRGVGLALRNSEIFEVRGKGGFLKSVGVGGSLTGTPVDLGIIDDVYKDFMQANSLTVREAVWSWYQSVFLTRLHNDSQQLILFTRWHEDDLAARILKDAAPGEWEVVSIPALKEDTTAHAVAIDTEDPRGFGEALWPEKHSQKRLEDFRAKYPTAFQCLYQQKPAKKEGNKIKRHWFSTVSFGQMVQRIAGKPFKNDVFVDGAYTDKTKNDPTGKIGAVFCEKTLYILDFVQAWKEFPDLVRDVKDYAGQPNINLNGYLMGSGSSIAVRIEPKASGKSLRQTLVTYGINAIETPAPTDDKTARVDTCSPFLESGRCVLVEGSWNEAFLNEVCGFPVQPHDEAVDLLCMAIDHYELRNTTFGLIGDDDEDEQYY